MGFQSPRMSENIRRRYFTSLRNAMKLEHGWKSCTEGNAQFPRSCRFHPAGNVEPFVNIQRGECSYRAWFPESNGKIVAGLIIRQNQALFNAIHELRAEIESDFGSVLDWTQRLCRDPGQRRKFVFTSRPGSIQSLEDELLEISEWHIATLLKLDEAFTHRITQVFSTL